MIFNFIVYFFVVVHFIYFVLLLESGSAVSEHGGTVFYSTHISGRDCQMKLSTCMPLDSLYVLDNKQARYSLAVITQITLATPA